MKSLVNLDTKKRLQQLLDNLSCLTNVSSLEVPELLKCKVSKAKKVNWSLCLSFEINACIEFHQEIK